MFLDPQIWYAYCEMVTAELLESSMEFIIIILVLGQQLMHKEYILKGIKLATSSV